MVFVEDNDVCVVDFIENMQVCTLLQLTSKTPTINQN